MKRFYLLALLLVGLMTACQKEDFVSVSSDPGFDVTASMEAMVETRTQLVPGANGNYGMVWSANDAISVFNDGCHWKYYVKGENAGGVNAKLSFDPSFDSSISGGIENEGSADVFVAVYPFSEETVISKSGDDYVINTVIPTEQNFVSGSFGQNASLMVAVNALKPSYSFRNVGAVLCMPLKGEANIVSATLESAAHNIAGAAVVTAVAENGYDPIVSVENGVNKVALMFAEGVELSKDEATNFCFVLAPGTYEANDLKVTFYDNKGNYFESKITLANTFVRSQVLTFGVRTFSVTGTEKLNQKVVAKAGATMVAERIVPALPSLDYVRTWLETIANDPDASTKIKEVVAYIGLKNYRAAYDLLGGVPGFELQTTEIKAYGIGEAEIGSLGVFSSLLGELDNVNSIATLIPFLETLNKAYETSNAGGKINEMFVNLLTGSEDILDNIIEKLVGIDADKNTSTEEIFAEYKTNVKNSLYASILTANGVKLVASGDNKTALQEYVDAAQSLYDNIDNYTSKAAIEKAINSIKPVSVKFKIFTKEYEFSFDPADFLTFSATFDDKLADALKNSADFFRPLYKTAIDNILKADLVEILKESLEDPDSYQSKIVTSLFANEQFMASFKSALVKVVEEIEATVKDNTDANNSLVLAGAKENAIHFARLSAVNQLGKELENVNNNEIAKLYDGPWGWVKEIVTNPNYIGIFTQLKLDSVYTALKSLITVLEDMVTYTELSVSYDIEKYEDYQENVDWWLQTINE